MSSRSVIPIKENVEQLYSEIRQIHAQYQKEVPKKRRPWPESIQSRILELWRLGVSSNQIAEETGLPTQSIYSWRQRLKKQDPGFLRTLGIELALKRRYHLSIRFVCIFPDDVVPIEIPLRHKVISWDIKGTDSASSFVSGKLI